SASASATQAVEPHNTRPTTTGISTTAVATRFHVMRRSPPVTPLASSHLMKGNQSPRTIANQKITRGDKRSLSSDARGHLRAALPCRPAALIQRQTPNHAAVPGCFLHRLTHVLLHSLRQFVRPSQKSHSNIISLDQRHLPSQVLPQKLHQKIDLRFWAPPVLD